MNLPDPCHGDLIIPPHLLLHAYRTGLFPMGLPDKSIGWFSPDPRAVIPLAPEKFHISKSLVKTVKRHVFEIRLNTVFEAVITACAEREDTWIDDAIRSSYLALHHKGYAHSVESWRDGHLVGGLYGVSVGGAFFGESMFHRETDASKVALVALVHRLRQRGFTLLDTQWTTPHLSHFGAHVMPRRVYLRHLQSAIKLPITFLDLDS